MEIRELQKTDIEYLRYIVVKTARGEYKNKPEATKLLFCDYYAQYGVGYVLVDDNRVVGYIIASEDYKKYIEVYKREFLPKLKEVDKKEYHLKKLEMVVDKLLGKKYPAHLHCDILEEYCGSGYGSKLMQQLLNKLKADNVRGVYLGLDKTNTRAINYYKKFGFYSSGILRLFGIYKKEL